jgi:hypothetical protein
LTAGPRAVESADEGYEAVREALFADRLGTALPQFVQPYYEQLRSDCEAAGIAVAAPPEQGATWRDLYQMELSLLRVRNEDELRRYAWVVRTRFRNVAGERAFQAYLNSQPPEPTSVTRDVLLADLLTLVRRTYYLTVLAPASETIRQQLLLGAVGISIVVVGIVVLIIAFHARVGDLLLIVLLAGGAGGTMSLVQRIQSLPEVDPILLRLSGRGVVIQSLIIPPLTGMIFAVVLYMMFIGKVVSADFIPKFTNPPDPKSVTKGLTFDEFFIGTNPVDAVSYGLMIAWAFVAGFAERFVPDAIGRMTAQRTKQDPAA